MKNINFEIKQLQKLNFITENEIKKIKFYINYIKEKINELKKIDFVIEAEKDIILSSKNEINIVETQLNMKLLELRKKLNILKSQEEDFKKKIEFTNKKINEGKDILNNVNNNKKYINPSEIIDEDKNEDFTKSISNFTNSLSLNNTKHYYLNSLDSNEKYSGKSKMHNRNLIFLDSFILKDDNKSENIGKKINENNLINEESNKNENQYFLNILESEK